MINVLKNPKTNFYNDFKDYVLGPKIQYYYYGSSTHPDDSRNWLLSKESLKSEHVDVPYYSHIIVERPDGQANNKIPKITSELFKNTLYICDQILNHNNIDYTYFLRMNINVVHPQKNVVKSIPHTDHNVPHKNLIIYFTDSGGKTFVGDEVHDPKEDDIVLFDGTEHFMETPELERRIILVATFV